MSSYKGVHNRIHNLRGEQFRHLQNLSGSRSHLTSANRHAVPSLPLRLLSLADPSLDFTDADHTPPPLQTKSRLGSTTESSPSDGTSFKPPAGPTPPKSWRLNPRKDIRDSPEWRAEALSLVFDHLNLAGLNTTTTSSPTHECHYATPRIPPLSLLCFQLCLSICTTSELKEIIPYIPPHLRRDLVRFTAVRSPLSSAKLYTLWEPYSHAHGEIVVVGPDGVLRDDHFLRGHVNSTNVSNESVSDTKSEDPGSRDWDTDDTDPPTPLTTLVLLTTSLSVSTPASLPPTLTHLALINLSTPVSLHRLPNICPLLVMLDVSYNSWLGTFFTSGPSNTTGILGEPQQPRDLTLKAVVGLERVNWKRWSHLKVLGFRGNYVSEEFVQRVNEGRWDDIKVVF